MSTTKLVIRESRKNKSGKTTIFIRVYKNGEHIAISTNEKIEPEYWNKEKGQVRKGFRGYVKLNDFLKGELEKVNTIIRESRFNNIEPDLNFIKQKYIDLKQGIIRTTKGPMTDFNVFIEESKVKKKIGTVKTYKSTLNHLIEYCNYKKLNRLAYDNFDITFYNDFVSYLIVVKKLTNNTVGRYVKCLKTFLVDSFEKGYHKNEAFRKFKVLKEETNIIYLTFEELMTLFKLEIENKRLENVRDLFCLACLTGLRFSDLINIKPENIKENHIELNTIKTKDPLIIPINKYARQLLDRMPKESFKFISNQKMNEYLKELGEIAGINEPTKIVRYSGSKRIETSGPKYEFMSTHMARRTFVTISLEKGMRAEVLMKITGHTSYTTLKKYIKIVDKIKFDEMNKTWN